MSHEPQTHDLAELVSEIESIKARLSKLETGGTYKRPTIEAVNLYGAKIGLPPDQCEWFFNFYESNGWRVGRNPMKSWQAAMVNWRKNWQSKGSGVGTRNGHTTPTMFEMKCAMEAKQTRMKELTERHYNDSGAFHEWTNEPARQEFILLKKQVRELNARIGDSA